MIESFSFTPVDLVGLRRKEGRLPFKTGIVFEHRNRAYPPFILFWTLKYRILKEALGDLGFSYHGS